MIIKPASLRIGDLIIVRDAENRIVGQVPVKKLRKCGRRGIPNIHVNTSNCYSGIAVLEVLREIADNELFHHYNTSRGCGTRKPG